MKTTTFYKMAIAGLVLLNIIVLSLFFFTRPRPAGPMGQGPMDPLRALVLNENQHKEVRLLTRAHGERVREFSRRQADLLQPYFMSLVDTSSMPDTAMILEQVGALERQKISVTYQHLLEIKDNLTDAQKANYEKFVNSVVHRLILTRKKDHPRPKDSNK